MAEARKAHIEVDDLEIFYGDVPAVRGVSFSVLPGEQLTLLGPSGCGKTTTLRAIAGLEQPSAGEIRIGGTPVYSSAQRINIPAEKRGLSMVFQSYAIWPHMTVFENVAYGLRVRRESSAAIAQKVERALGIANLSDRRNTKVDHLSGGMRRRLLIARGLVHQPRLILLDEPTVGLDPQVRQELWALVDRLRSEGVSILMSTHYIEEAERLADTVTIMSHGKAVATGTPRDLIAEHAGPEAVEVYGPPAKLQEVERDAKAKGLSTRRTGTSISILHANGDSPEGERRPTNLEDVFVLLTGEEIA